MYNFSRSAALLLPGDGDATLVIFDRVLLSTRVLGNNANDAYRSIGRRENRFSRLLKSSVANRAFRFNLFCVAYYTI